NLLYSGGTTGNGDLTLRSIGAGIKLTGTLAHTGSTKFLGTVTVDKGGNAFLNHDTILENSTLTIGTNAASDVYVDKLIMKTGSTVNYQGTSMAGVVLSFGELVYVARTLAVTLNGSGDFIKTCTGTLTLDKAHTYT